MNREQLAKTLLFDRQSGLITALPTFDELVADHQEDRRLRRLRTTLRG